jgi:hypothetical protein
MLIRLHQVGVPEFEGVAVLPREQLLTIGFANLLGPALVALILIASLFAILVHRSEHPARRPLSRRPPSRPPGRKPVRAWLKRTTRDWEPEKRTRVRVAVVGGIVFPVVLAVVVPLEWVSVVAVALTAFLGGYTAWRLRILDVPLPPPSRGVRIELACLWVVTILSAAIAGEALNPAPLPTASIKTTNGPVGGYYLNSRSEGLLVGRRDFVVLVPTSVVQGATIHRAPGREKRARTLVERITGLTITR